MAEEETGVGREQIRETVQEEMEKDEGRGSRYFTKQQIVEEMEVNVRKLYGRDRNDFDPDSDPDAYVGLVDAWMVVPYMLEKEYQERFLERSRVTGWSRKINRHFIPNKFVLSKVAIHRAMEDGFIYPRVWEKIKFKVLVEFPPLGPPMAWYGLGGAPSREEAQEWVSRMEGGGVQKEEVKGISEKASAEKQLENLQRDAERYMNTYEQALKKARNAEDRGQRQKYRDMAAWAKRNGIDTKHRIEYLKKDLEEE